MTRVLAAIDDSAAARAVLETAATLAQAAAAEPHALHVREDHRRTLRHAAASAGIPLREVTGDVVENVVEAADADDVLAVVVGARSRPAGRRPAGHIALELMTRISKPLVVVPPNAPPCTELRRMAVPLDGTRATAKRSEGAIELAIAAGMEIVIIHVCGEDRIPLYTDQPQHDTRAFAEEFTARYAPDVPAHLELRVGVPAEEVLTAALALDADLCALAWAQSLEPGRARVVKEMLARSPIPVLLLPLNPTPGSSVP